MHIDELKAMSIDDLSFWLVPLREKRKEFDFWLGTGVLTAKLVSTGDETDRWLAKELARVAETNDRQETERRILRIFMLRWLHARVEGATPEEREAIEQLLENPEEMKELVERVRPKIKELIGLYIKSREPGV